jgi:hypothetical protein
VARPSDRGGHLVTSAGIAVPTLQIAPGTQLAHPLENTVRVARGPRVWESPVCESVRERWRDGVGRLPDRGWRVPPVLRGIRVGAGGRRANVGTIRDKDAGGSRRPRAVCESVRERWRDGVGRLPDLGWRVTVRATNMFALVARGTHFRHRDKAAGVGGLPRIACERAAERGRDGASELPHIGEPVTQREGCTHDGTRGSSY